MVVDSGSENNADSFTSGSMQGRTNINLRGLGLSSTLVLFDGRRQTVTGTTANDGSVFVNTSALPVIALDRVEVLKKGLLLYMVQTLEPVLLTISFEVSLQVLRLI